MTNQLRIVVTGHPLSGKSEVARQLAYQSAQTGGLPWRETDSALLERPGIAWSALSEVVSHWFDTPGPWIISGVAVPRALRKWRHRHPGDGPPVDHFVYVTRPDFTGLTPGQIRMATGIDTVVDGLRSWLAEVWTPVNQLISERWSTTFFESHRCWRCNSGARPCVQHGYYRCEFPHARND